MTMDWDFRPLRAPNLELAPVVDGFVVSRAGHDQIQFLNPTAALILELCNGDLPAGDLPALVASAFGLDAPPVQDVEACLITMLDQGLVVLAVPGVRTAS